MKLALALLGESCRKKESVALAIASRRGREGDCLLVLDMWWTAALPSYLLTSAS